MAVMKERVDWKAFPCLGAYFEAKDGVITPKEHKPVTAIVSFYSDRSSSVNCPFSHEGPSNVCLRGVDLEEVQRTDKRVLELTELFEKGELKLPDMEESYCQYSYGKNRKRRKIAY